MRTQEGITNSEGGDFPAFAVTTDLVILTVRSGSFSVLLVERSEEPFAGVLALPGGFVGPDQELHAAASHKLVDKTGLAIEHCHLEQLGTFGSPTRDPRMRVVSVAYLAMVANIEEPEAGTDTQTAFFTPAHAACSESLAFDHQQILAAGLERARAKLEYTTLATHFCNPEFTLTELRAIYEAVWDVQLDPRNFSRKVLASPGFIKETGRSITQAKGRPARLYCQGPAEKLHPPIPRN